jgi:tryptophan synthase alpha chain
MNNGTQPARTRIDALFHNLKQANRAGLVAYLTAGDPAPEKTAGLVAALERGGADLIELGVPFSDPIADGPVVQRASDRALRAGTTLTTVLDIARDIRRTSNIPLLLFTYLNPVLAYGIEKLASDARTAGIDGCLLIDLSVEEAETHIPVMRRHSLDTVFLAAPTSTERRLRLVAKYSTGFVYLVSRTGVTGEQSSVSASVAPLIKSMRNVTGLPLAVGFGIANAQHAAEVGALADAVVVGSALVRVIEKHGNDPDLEAHVEDFARHLRTGLERRNG